MIRSFFRYAVALPPPLLPAHTLAMQHTLDGPRREHPTRTRTEAGHLFEAERLEFVDVPVEGAPVNGEPPCSFGDRDALVEAMARVRRCQRELRRAVLALTALVGNEW